MFSKISYCVMISKGDDKIRAKKVSKISNVKINYIVSENNRLQGTTFFITFFFLIG